MLKVLIKIMLLAVLGGSLIGCTSIEPWVKPYERANLATEVMKFDRNPVSDAYFNHVYEAREGARGASGSSGGGCGCN